MKRVLCLFIVLATFFLAGCTQLVPGMVNQPPDAVIVATPQQGPAPLTVMFNARSSHDDGTIAEHHWDFDDPHDAAPMSGVDVTHTYAYPGIYVVRLIVIDDRGEMSTERIMIEVTNPPPVASFSLSDDNPVTGATVTFDASGSYDPNDEIKTYTWDFGDGTTATGREVTHSYDQAGDFAVSLTVTDRHGATSTDWRALSVQDGRCGIGGC